MGCLASRLFLALGLTLPPDLLVLGSYFILRSFLLLQLITFYLLRVLVDLLVRISELRKDVHLKESVSRVS